MATYEEFKELIREKAEEEIGGRATIQTMHKNNGVKLDALVIMTMDRNVSPSIYLNAYYKEYLDCTDREGALEEIWEEIKATYYKNLPRESMDTDFLFDFSRVREKIRMKIINTEKNRDRLEDMVYIPYLDLSIVFMIALDVEDCVMATIAVRKEFMECWGVDENDLWNISVENMAGDYEVVSMDEVIAAKTGWKGEGDSWMYILTNHRQIQGAVTMILPGVLGQIAEEWSARKLVIIPSSVHEVLVCAVEDESDLNDFNYMVKEVNSTVLSQEEVLSDHVYVYDRKIDKLKIA